jgi:hypothetical protein
MAMSLMATDSGISPCSLPRTPKRHGAAGIRWHASAHLVFPNYSEVSGSAVGGRRLRRAKPVVLAILAREDAAAAIRRAFVGLARRRGAPGAHVAVDLAAATHKVRGAKLSSTIRPDESAYGMTANGVIWITPTKMSDDMLIGTLLHEALHDVCTINGKFICETDEHRVMRALGEQC